MKILQIAPAWVDVPPKDYGGTEWVIYNLVKGLSQLGHDVSVFATKNSQVPTKLDFVFDTNLVDQGIDWKLALPSLIHYHQAFKNAFNFDVVHAHLSSETDLMLLPFLSDLTEAGVPNIMTIHSHFPFDTNSLMDAYYLKYYGPNITAVNISQSMRGRMPQEFWDGGFVYNSLDTSSYQFNPNGGDYFTWLGKILPAKGTSEVIQAVKKAGEQLIFAGVVDKYDSSSIKYWKELVEPFIDGKQIQYLGPADLKLKNKMLGGAKAFLNPITWDEPFGMVIAESLACGTPVISYNRGAAPEIIKDKITGFLVVGLEEMVEKMKKVGKIKRKDCRKHIENNFSIKAIAAEYIKIYNLEVQKYTPSLVDNVLIPPISEPLIANQYSAISHSITIPKKKS